jgi:sugar lactone lactonase YvrE
VWSWEGNNVDGPIAGDKGTVLFANNDASNVMQMDPATGLASILYSNTNTGGAVSRSKTGALFVAERRLGSAVEQLEPQRNSAQSATRAEVVREGRKMLANSFRGEPLECVGGVINDLMADARGGVYFSVTGATDSGVFYADPKGVVSQYGKDVPLANGIILSPQLA